MKANKPFRFRAIVPSYSVFIFSLFLIACTFLSAPVAYAVTKSNNTPGSVDNNTVNQIYNFSTADFGGSPPVTDVDVTIDFMNTITTCPNIGFYGFNEEISFWVTSPSGTKVVLVYDAYNSHGRGITVPPTYNGIGCIRAVVTFDDAAGTPVGGGDPVSGTFQPEEPLSLFNGESAVGNWTVSLADGTGTFPTCFFSVSITINGSALPVEDLEFDVRQRWNDLELDWLAGNEEGVSAYEVERAVGNSDFRKLGQREARGEGRYAFVDDQGGWEEGQVLGYRLVEIGENGNRAVLETRWVTFRPEGQKLKLWPNPARDFLWLESSHKNEIPEKIELLSLQGQVVRTFRPRTTESRIALPLEGLPTGIYFLSAGTQKFRIAIR